MDHNPIYMSFLKRITGQVTGSTLQDIIARIRSTELEEAVFRIQNSDASIKQHLKQQLLPAFFPTVLLGDRNQLDDVSSPTGVIQFDLDVKDNSELDLVNLRNNIQSLPETIYAFASPSGGLKFGLLTDFHRHQNESTDNLKQRYKHAYQQVHKSVLNRIAVEVSFDTSVGSLKYACYLSHDANAYFNPDAKILEVDHYYPIVVPIPRIQNPHPISHPQIQELLSYIPPDLRYPERLPINVSVMMELGMAAIPLLESHWSTSNRTKLQNDLQQQLKEVNRGTLTNNIGTLINVAKKHGWRTVTGSKRKTLIPKPASLQFEPLLAPQDAEAKLKMLVADFFADGKSRFINFSTGAGKTQTLIKVLEEIDPTSKILYLGKTHELAEQICATFYTLRSLRQQNRSFPEQVQSKSRMIHLSGREALCENKIVKTTYHSKGITIPADQCTRDCPFDAVCAYKLQFNNPLGNIRVMMHNEYFNPPAKWSSGMDASGNPHSKRWIPDFIIIDEDIFQKDKDPVENQSSRFTSIKLLLDQLKAGRTISETVLTHAENFIRDGLDNQLPRKPWFINTRQYLEDIREWNRKKPAYSILMDNLMRFAITEDKTHLKGMRYDTQKYSLIQSQIKPIAERHKDIPTLYLDATASPLVIQELLPTVEFHSIRVQTKSHINLYQLPD